MFPVTIQSETLSDEEIQRRKFVCSVCVIFEVYIC